MTGMHCDDGHFPIAPVPCRLFVNSGIRVHEKTMVCLDKTPVPIRLWDTIPKAAPRLRKEDANPSGDPIDLPCCSRGDTEQDHLGHTLRMPSGIGEGQG